MTPQRQLPLPSGQWLLPRQPWGFVLALLWSSESSEGRSSLQLPTESPVSIEAQVSQVTQR